MSNANDLTRRQALRRVGALLGGAVSAPTVAGVFSGCERITGPEWTPQTLSAEQNEMVVTMAEIIIPTTDTPGAGEAYANRFIDALLTGSYPAADRDRFLKGLAEVDVRCRDAYDAVFTGCTEEQQLGIVAELDDETFGSDAPEFDPETPPFFRMMKELVIIGYYTSEVGATQELKTNMVPGRYEGDVPYDKIGRAWA